MEQGKIGELVCHQLSAYWLDFDEKKVKDNVPYALERIENDFKGCAMNRVFSPIHSVSWAVFLYYLSNSIYIQGGGMEADLVYYLNKIMHANDWYYEIQLPNHFLAEHPVGSVLGRAKYGDYLFVYQGTTIGGNRKNGKPCYPHLGKNVLLYANSTLLGNTLIGNNVIISADTYLINEVIPDNCIVFGRTPDIRIVQKSESEIKDMTSHIWKW